MITEEMEDGLRRGLARAAAGFDGEERARQRLLARDYHPRRGNKRLALAVGLQIAFDIGDLEVEIESCFGRDLDLAMIGGEDQEGIAGQAAQFLIQQLLKAQEEVVDDFRQAL